MPLGIRSMRDVAALPYIYFSLTKYSPPLTALASGAVESSINGQ